MADLDSTNNPITANGDYDIQVAPGSDFRIRFSNMAGTGDQIDAKELVGESASNTNYETIRTFTISDGANIKTTSGTLRFTVTNWSQNIYWTVVAKK